MELLEEISARVERIGPYYSNDSRWLNSLKELVTYETFPFNWIQLPPANKDLTIGKASLSASRAF